MGQIRLAERRGIFQRRRLSPVQSLAIEILMSMEAWQVMAPNREADARRVLDAVSDVISEPITEENFNDNENVIYKMPDMDKADIQDVLSLMGQGGTLNLSEVENGNNT